MKMVLHFLFAIFSVAAAIAANEEKNLSLLMMNGPARFHSSDQELNGKVLALELAEAFQAKDKKKVSIENHCETPRRLMSEDNEEEMRFEDCLLTIKKKKNDSVAIQYQIKTKIKNGKAQRSLRKKMLRASYL